MKKYIIGTIFGFVLATAVSVNAEGVNRLIDQVVQGVFPVTVDGTSIGEAVVIDNKTYLPVREFGEAVGYTVSFTDSMEVILTKNVVPTIPTDTAVTPQPTVPTKTVEEQIIYFKNKIEDEKSNIESNKLFILANENFSKEPKANKEMYKKAIDIYSNSIKESELRISQYESQIAGLESQK